MVCTSPPYWGLRKYSGEQEMVWGDNQCKHQWDIQDKKVLAMTQGGEAKRPYQEQIDQDLQYKAGFCSLCGAWRGAYGLEPTPEMYVEHSIQFLRAIRRVLRKDGVVFWNIGDAYIASVPGNKELLRWQHGNSAENIEDTTGRRSLIQSYGEWTGEKARQGDGEFKKKGM